MLNKARNLWLSLALLPFWSSQGLALPLSQERVVQQLATAYFSGQKAVATESALAAALGAADGDLPSGLKSLAAALNKLQGDGERGLLRFKEGDFVNYARTVAYSDVAVALAALARVQTAVEGVTLSVEAKDLLTDLKAQLDAIYSSMAGES